MDFCYFQLQNSGGVGDITWNTTSTGGAALTTCSIDMLGGSSTNAEIVAHVTAAPIDCSLGKFEVSQNLYAKTRHTCATTY